MKKLIHISINFWINNALNHKLAQELFKTEIQEKRNFVKEQLCVKYIMINQDQ